MTREEAIHHLYTYSSTNGSGQTTDEQHNEAKRMAIKALEQEPISDILEDIYTEKDNVAALGIAIETIRKYQKIQEIINNTDYIQEDVIRYKMICGVVEDGNDQISKSTSK